MKTKLPDRVLQKFQKLWPRSKKVLLWSSALLLLVGLAHWKWVSLRDIEPAVTIPKPVMPAVNAFDYNTAASKAFTDSTKAGFAILTVHSPSAQYPEDHPYTLAEKDALIKENATTLGLVRTGFSYPYVAPPLKSAGDEFQLYFAKDRKLTRLFVLESADRAGHGDWTGSIGSDLDAIQLGVEIPHGGALLPSLTGIACEFMGRRLLWHDYSHLTGPEAQAAAARLQQITAHRFSFAQTLQEEKWQGQTELSDMLHQPGGEQSVFTDNDHPRVPLSVQWKLYFTKKRTVLSNYTRYMDTEIQRADRRGNQPFQEIPSDPINQALPPLPAEFRHVFDNNEAQDNLLIATLALHAYQCEHHAYPASLTALVPGYLSVIPNDPYATSGALNYRKSNSHYLLYSVGPDRKDDGGRPIFDARKNTQTHSQTGGFDRDFVILENSKGDILAGTEDTYDADPARL